MDAEDLTEEQIEEFRQMLLELKEELSTAMHSTDESSKTVQLDNLDPSDSWCVSRL